MWFVYIIETEKGRFYTGVTCDVNRRFQQHLGKIKGGAKFFRSDSPALLVFCQSHCGRSSAQAMESQIKKLSRQEKELLIYGENFLG